MVSFTILFILSKKLCGTALIYFFAPAVYGSASLALQLLYLAFLALASLRLVLAV